MALRSFNNPQARFLDFFSKTGTDASNEVPPPSGIVATGGVISDYTSPPGAVYRSHVFTSSGTFTVSSIGTYGSNLEYLVVAGGGGGGKWAAGGGGGGGFYTNVSGATQGGPSGTLGPAYPVSVASYTVTVGAGGAGGATDGANGVKGGDSIFGSGSPNPITATGGGYGGGYNNAGGSGGSGGGRHRCRRG